MLADSKAINKKTPIYPVFSIKDKINMETAPNKEEIIKIILIFLPLRPDQQPLSLCLFPIQTQPKC